MQEFSRRGLSGGLAGTASVNLVVAHDEASAGLKGEISIVPTPAEPVESPTGAKLYLRTDMGDCLAHASGRIYGFVKAWAGLGVVVPITNEFLGVKKTFNIAEKDLVKLPGLCAPNTFVPQEGEVFASATPLGNVLWLNIGPLATQRNFLEDLEDETITVRQVTQETGASALRVIFAGRFEDYPIEYGRGLVIDTIVGIGGSGADVIRLEEGMTVNVVLYGGDGPDTLISHSTGTSYLYSDDEDDDLWGELDLDWFFAFDEEAGNSADEVLTQW